MLQKLKDLFDMEEPILKLVRKGMKFSIIICSISIISLLIYNKYYISHDLYTGSFILFRTGLLFAIQFLICGIAFNTIRKQMN